MFNLGFGELGVILVVALIFLGPKMLPEIASGLGKIIREIRKATADIRQDIEIDEAIRGPLRELREAATLPPEELKRRDEAKAARQKAEAEAEKRRREAEAAKQAEEAARKQQAEKAAAEAPPTVLTTGPATGPSDVVSPGGTMIANPPPGDPLRTLTPLPDLHSPPPVVTAPPRPPLPPPPPRPPRAPRPATSEATVVDLQAQLRASHPDQATLFGRPVLAPDAKPAPPKAPDGKKS